LSAEGGAPRFRWIVCGAGGQYVANTKGHAVLRNVADNVRSRINTLVEATWFRDISLADPSDTTTDISTLPDHFPDATGSSNKTSRNKAPSSEGKKLKDTELAPQ
jgi:hypothetical protein